MSNLYLQRFGRNFECKVFACSHHHCVESLYRILVLIVAFDITASLYNTAVTLGNRFLFAAGSRTLLFGCMLYGRLTLATAGFLV